MNFCTSWAGLSLLMSVEVRQWEILAGDPTFCIRVGHHELGKDLWTAPKQAHSAIIPFYKGSLKMVNPKP